MGKINLEIGESFTFTKTFTETDVTLFSAISGDLFPIHINEEYAKNTRFGTRICYGCLTFSLASTVSGLAALKTQQLNTSMCYNDVRFLKPVFFGDTITAKYTIVSLDEERDRSLAKCEMTNQRGEVVLTCEHTLKFFL